MGKILEFWMDNLKTNYKLVSIFFTEIVITTIIIVAYGSRTGMYFADILFAIWISIQTTLFLVMRLIGKGEVAEVIKKYNKEVKVNEQLREEAHYNQVIAAYAIQLAAVKGQVPESIIAGEKWIEANKVLEILNGKEAAEKAKELTKPIKEEK